MIGNNGYLPPVVLQVAADIDKFKSGLGQAERELKGFGSAVSGETSAIKGKFSEMGAMVKTALAGAFVSFAYSAIQSASDLNETLNKTKTIFGTSSDALIKWSETASDTFGQTQQEALDAASTFALFAGSAGLSGQATNDFATSMTELASDLGSFYNTDPSRAVYALGAALRGENEPIRSYNVMINDMALKQKALEMGLYSGTGELDTQTKVLATYNLIMEQTKVAQGDFSKTSDGLANSQRTLGKKFQELKVQLVDVFLPAVEKVVNAAKGLLDFVSANLYIIQTLGAMFVAFKVATAVAAAYKTVMGAVAVQQSLAAASGVALTTGQGLATVATMNLTRAMHMLKAAFLSNPIGLIAMAFVALVAAVMYAWNNFEWFRKGIAIAAQFIMEKMALLADKILGYWKTIADFAFNYGRRYLQIMEAVYGWVPGLGGKITQAREFIDTLQDTVGTKLDEWGDTLRENAKKIGKSAYKNIMAGFGESPDEDVPEIPTFDETALGTSLDPTKEGASGSIDALKQKIKDHLAALKEFRKEFRSAQKEMAGDLPAMRLLAQQSLDKARSMLKQAKQDLKDAKGTDAYALALKEVKKATQGVTEATKYQNEVIRQTKQAALETAAALDVMSNSYARSNSYIAAQNRVSGYNERGTFIEVPVVIDGQVLFRVSQKAALLNNRRNVSNGLAVSGSVI